MISLSRSNFILHSSGKLEDKYDSQSKIGEGAFGSVFSSILKETSEPRAIKHIIKSSVKHPERLQAEISTLLSCDHPHIIKLYEIFEDRKNLFLIMEQCMGGELFDYILNKSKIAEAEASVLFRQIMLAVNYLHNKNIAHRDLKPENLMFSDSSTLKLIDFGIAKELKPEEEMKTRAGTPFYMSPEILKGSYTLQTDIWSAGVILYTMLCGYPPFYGSTDPEIFKKVLAGNFSFRGAEWKNISNSAKDLIRNMLIVNTDMRYNSQQVLEHPWLSINPPQSNLSITKSDIQSYLSSSHLKKAILFSIVVHCDDKNLQQVKETFLALDLQGLGSLNKENVQFQLALNIPAEPEIIKEFIEAMDLNQNGTIEYSEFISAVMASQGLLTKDKISQSFLLFDRNKNGKVSADDLQKLMQKGNRKNSPMFKRMLQEVGCNSAAGVNFEEFVNLVDSSFA